MTESDQALPLEILRYLYRQTGGRRNVHLEIGSIAADLGLDPILVERATDQLELEGLIEHVALGGIITITNRGVLKLEVLAKGP